jgi:transposase
LAFAAELALFPLGTADDHVDARGCALSPAKSTTGATSDRRRYRTVSRQPDDAPTASVRKALYLPAIVAMRANPPWRGFADQLRAQGKRPKVVITAVMRKLLLLACTLLRTGQPFSPTHGQPSAGA